MLNKNKYKFIFSTLTFLLIFNFLLINVGAKENNMLQNMSTNISENSSNKKIGWGQGTNIDKNNRPIDAIEYNKKYLEYSAYFIDDGSNSNNIYLTFDEGYENGYTSNILDVLKCNDVKAVFFVTYDYAKKNPELINRMINEGHTLGNHTYSHPSMPDLGSQEEMKKEISKLHDYILENFNYQMTLFRPPRGEFSESSLKATQQLGYKTLFWSFAYNDWNVDKQMDSSKALNLILSKLHNGEIMLLHAVSKTNADILDPLIKEIKSRGMQFKLF